MSRESIRRETERLREKARHDEAQALHHAEKKGRIEIARTMKQSGMLSDQIAQFTGLPREEIERL